MVARAASRVIERILGAVFGAEFCDIAFDEGDGLRILVEKNRLRRAARMAGDEQPALDMRLDPAPAFGDALEEAAVHLSERAAVDRQRIEIVKPVGDRHRAAQRDDGVAADIFHAPAHRDFRRFGLEEIPRDHRLAGIGVDPGRQFGELAVGDHFDAGAGVGAGSPRPTTGTLAHRLVKLNGSGSTESACALFAMSLHTCAQDGLRQISFKAA